MLLSLQYWLAAKLAQFAILICLQSVKYADLASSCSRISATLINAQTSLIKSLMKMESGFLSVKNVITHARPALDQVLINAQVVAQTILVELS